MGNMYGDSSTLTGDGAVGYDHVLPGGPGPRHVPRPALRHTVARLSCSSLLGHVLGCGVLTGDPSVGSVSATRLHDEELGFAAQQRTVAVVEELVDVLHVDGLAVSSVHHTVLSVVSPSLTI